jgi:hypothetical protein
MYRHLPGREKEFMLVDKRDCLLDNDIGTYQLGISHGKWQPLDNKARDDEC